MARPLRDVMDELEGIDKDTSKLVRQLERAANKLEGKRTEHFTDSHSLYTTCSWAMIMRRHGTNNRTIRCSNLGTYMPEDISECNQYSGITTLSLQQMAEIATIIDISPRKKVGFYKEA